MLKKIEVTPAVLARVVHSAIRAPATHASKARAALEIEVDVELPLVGVERCPLDKPWRSKAKGQLKKIGVAHADKLAHRRPPSQRPRQDRPTRREFCPADRTQGRTAQQNSRQPISRVGPARSPEGP
jgi:hypothetical protein